MIKAIIFDCFGVLYLDWAASLAVTYPDHSAELRDLNAAADHGFLDRLDYITAASSLVAVTPEAIESFIRHEHHLNVSLVEKIRYELKPDHKVGVLTNLGQGWVHDFLDVQLLQGLFDAVVVSAEEGITKPQAEIYEIAAKRLGVRVDECVIIDDIEDNCAGADAAGMKSIHFLSNEQLSADLRRLLAANAV